MKLKKVKLSLVKLPTETELILYLIRQELKLTKIYNGLHNIGYSDSYYESHLGTLILALMEFDDTDDSLIDFYVKLIDKYSEKIEPNNDSMMKCTMKVYQKLNAEKKKRSSKLKAVEKV